MRLSTLSNKEDVLQGLSHLKNGGSLYVFDTETTGLSAKNDRILTFSSQRIVLGTNGEICALEEFEVWIKNGPVPAEASAINGITDDMLNERGIPEDEAMERIRDFLGDEPFLVSYNGKHFDSRFVNEAYLRSFGEPFTCLGHIDVLHMAREVLDLKSYRLANVAHELGADRDVSFHHSMDDVEATLRVFRLLIPYYNKRTEPEDAEMVSYRYAKVIRAHYYEHPLNRKVQRIYVYTYPGFSEKTYYDLYRSEWRTERSDLDLRDIRRQVLRKYKAGDEKELAKILQ